MDKIFLSLLNRSIAAGWLILAVLALRLLLRKAPKWIPCLLWGIAAVRLACPFSLESAFSLIPSKEILSPATVMYAQEPEIHSGISTLNSTLNPIIRESLAPVPGTAVNPLQAWMSLGGILWAAGLAVLLLYALASFLRLHRRLRESVPLKENIRLCDAVKSPFILGIVRPRIYLPSGLKEEEMEYVLAHERAHLKRKDHWWKLLGYLLLAVYWFRPLVWAAYILFCRDMELACDERVIQGMDMEGKKAYSHALVTCSVSRRAVMVCPVAFGEIGVRKRVKEVLRYRKPAFWMLFAAVFICAIVALCFLTNPRQDTYKVRITIPAGSESGIYYSDEEISPYGKTITLWADEGLGDTEVVLLPSEMENEQEQLSAPEYITPGMPVKMEAEKDVWYRIGVNMSNPAEEDKKVYVKAEGVQIRIACPVAEENVKYDIIPMMMVNDKYYYDTGRVSSRTERSREMDGEITSCVDGSEKPVENNQSNFGAGYGYQFGENDTIEVHMNGKWEIFEYRSGDGSLIRYGDKWYSQGDLSEETIEWLYWYNGLSEEEQVAVSSIPSDLYDLIYTGDETEMPAETEDAADTSIDAAIQRAILEKNVSVYSDAYGFACCDFFPLATEVAADNAGNGMVSYYGWALYQKYEITDEGIEDVEGSHIPVVLTFVKKDGNYELKEYWEPREGSYFVSDIRSKFPAGIAEDAIDSQKFGMLQIQSCYRQAVEFSGLDTEQVIGGLLETICSEPKASSNPQDYVETHSIEYRELLFYGEYTLRYCLNRFHQGKETGLEGRIMALVCEELLQTREAIPVDAATAETGQFWYDTLYAHGSNRVEPYLE